ncbi:MAG TPA: hypothetical protein DHV85_22050 [Candidatus Accumulibacter sp.]|nr:hypothetical protein [Accumulibacter sp.]
MDGRLVMVRESIEKAQAAARYASSFDGSQLAVQLAGIASLLERPPLVAVVGEFNAGKSTLINRLLNLETDVLPTDVLPTTALPLRIQYGHAAGLLLNRRNGWRELRAIDELSRYQHQSHTNRDDPGLPDVAFLEIFLPNPLLHSFSLLDTPGLSDPKQDIGPTLAAIREADAVIWCSMAPHAWKNSEAEFWSRMPRDVRNAAMLIVTHCDLLNNDRDRERLRHRLENETEGAFARVVMASFLDDGALARDSLRTVRAVVQEMVVDRAHDLRAVWATRSATSAVGVERCKRDCAPRTAAVEKLARACSDMKGEWGRARGTIRNQLYHTSKEFHSLAIHAGRMLQEMIIRREFREPVGVFAGGFFTPSYKVVWRPRWMEDLDWDLIPSKNSELIHRVSRLREVAASQIKKQVDGFIDLLSTAPDSLLGGLESSASQTIALLRQHALLIDFVFASAVNRAIGSIERAGFRQVSMLHRQERKHEKTLPNDENLRDLLDECFSFADAAEICRNDGLMQLQAMTRHVARMFENWEATLEQEQAMMASVRRELDDIHAMLSLNKLAEDSLRSEKAPRSSRAASRRRPSA